MSGILIVFIIEIILVVLVLGYSFSTGISPVPTSGKLKRALLELMPDIREGRIYELGSGWGTLAFPLADKYPGIDVHAYEISPVPWLYSRVRLLLFPRKNLKIYRKNFNRVWLDDASCIVCYLYPAGMKRLGEKFRRELKPGTVIISNTFEIPGWEPKALHEIDKLYDNLIYIYRMA